MQEEDYETVVANDGEVLEVPVHPRRLNLQTEIIVAVIGVIIFGSGVVCGLEWTKVTSALQETVTVQNSVPQTAKRVSNATATGTQVAATTSSKASPTDPGLVTGTFSGYFTTYDIEAWEERSSCNALIVVNGQQDLVKKYTGMIRDGNSVQRLTDSGQLILNLPWKSIPDADRNIIRASKASAQVTVTLTEARSNNAEADLCHSFFTYGGVTVTD
jgi:hypothetical protein